MNKRIVSIIIVCLMLISITTVFGKSKSDYGREVLQPNDGWGAYSTGTTGGSAASADQVFSVSSRAELIQALGGDNTTNKTNVAPKIIYVDGPIDLNADDDNNPAGPDYYSDPEYDFQTYLAQYDPLVWGNVKVSGPLEDARKRSQTSQKNRILINIGSNTTIIGREDAKITGGGLRIDNAHNVIIRNIEFEAPVDFFPLWDPTDGAGNWNSEYDSIEITNGSTHVWIDHNTFSDGDHPDSASGSYFGRPFQQHDGLLDIKNASDFVTVSYNLFQDHDKVSIIGSSDSRTTDRGHLKVTYHHNHFKNLGQRLPRVRFGEVHVYNNYYEFEKDSEYEFVYALGVGIESKIYAENNYFRFDWDIDPAKILGLYKGTSIYETGSFLNGSSRHDKADLVAAFNSANSIQLSTDAGWKPVLHGKIDPTQSVPAQVQTKAGAGRLN